MSRTLAFRGHERGECPLWKLKEGSARSVIGRSVSRALHPHQVEFALPVIALPSHRGGHCLFDLPQVIVLRLLIAYIPRGR